MKIQSRHSLRREPIQGSQIALARGARTGVRITRRPSERNAASNDPARSEARHSAAPANREATLEAQGLAVISTDVVDNVER